MAHTLMTFALNKYLTDKWIDNLGIKSFRWSAKLEIQYLINNGKSNIVFPLKWHSNNHQNYLLWQISVCNPSIEKHMLRKILNVYLIFQKIEVFKLIV